MKQILTVNNLVKTYNKVEAVKGISFDVKEKEIFALIGPNGAGKSTTLRILATILAPTSGEVKLEDLDVFNEGPKVRELISYLPEEAGAYKNLTGIGYLEFMASLYSKDRAEERIFVEFGKEVTGLKDRLRDKIKTYSKGMTRKLLLARTVMNKPKLAILDEPTSGLDVINAMEIRTMIKNLSKEGMSVLLSSHNMLEIEYLSDRVGIIDKGVIHDIGTCSELKAKHNAANLEEVFMNIVK